MEGFVIRNRDSHYLRQAPLVTYCDSVDDVGTMTSYIRRKQQKENGHEARNVAETLSGFVIVRQPVIKDRSTRRKNATAHFLGTSKHQIGIVGKGRLFPKGTRNRNRG